MSALRDKKEKRSTFLGAGAAALAAGYLMIVGCSIAGLTGGDLISELEEIGVPATARVLEIHETGITVNDSPVVGFVLEVYAEGLAPYRAETKALVSILAIPRIQPGAELAVRYDPEDPQRVAIDVAAESSRATELPTGKGADMSRSEHDLRVDYVELAATDLENTKAFYEAVFGWTFTDWGPDYTSFDDGRLSGGFQRADSVSTGGVLVVIYALDLEGTRSKVTEHGGAVVKEIFSFPGGRRFHFSDPSGNVLAVWSDQE